jgi:hypothetical protein
LSSAKLCEQTQVCQEEKDFYQNNGVEWAVHSKIVDSKAAYPSPACDTERQANKECTCALVFLHDCSVVACNESSGFCEDTPLPCAGISVATITAAVIGAAVITGIVVGIVACVLLAGGGVYAGFTAMNPDEESKISNNPLYQSNAVGGENPLNKS